MVNKILIDTNVLLDYLLEREPFFEDAKLLSGLINEDFLDFEDCLQMECAKSFGADYIVTRNVADFSASEVQAIERKDYLKL